MKRFCIFSALVVILVAGCLPANADTVINFASFSGNGITFNRTSGGEYINFSNLYVGGASDSANATSVVISPGAGQFFLNSVSSDGLTGYFATNSSSTLNIGNATSGVLSGSLQMVEIDTNTSHQYPNGHGSFSLTLVLSDMLFHSCTATGCTNSALLEKFAQLGNGSNAYNTLTFSFSASTASNARSLLGLTGANSTTVEGTLDSTLNTVTPEPVSLALFGTGLLMAGIKIRRGVAKA